jgi:hypothetical protein
MRLEVLHVGVKEVRCRVLVGGVLTDRKGINLPGAAVAIPFAFFASRLKGAPSAGVLGLAAFWSLVPGQLTFMSMGRRVSGDLVDTASVSVAAGAIISIALGTIVGWSVVRSRWGRAERPPAPVVTMAGT